MLLSVDGGATKTLALVFDEVKSRLKGLGVSGPSNLTSAGPVKARNNIMESVRMATEEANVDLVDIKRGIFGIAGIGDSKEMTELGEKIIDVSTQRSDFIKINDGIPAYFLGNLDQDGVVFAGGTGSVAFYQKHGSLERRGGWNWFVGDNGSASWIAKRAINIATMEEDGLFEERLIANEVEEYFHNDFREAIALIDKQQDKALVAGFAPSVSRLANEGYKIAVGIMEESASYVSNMVNTLRKEFLTIPLISILGGTMQAGDLYTSTIKSKIGEKVQIFLGYQVAAGGILMLLNNEKIKVDFNTRNRLLKEMDERLQKKDRKILTKYLHLDS